MYTEISTSPIDHLCMSIQNNKVGKPVRQKINLDNQVNVNYYNNYPLLNDGGKQRARNQQNIGKTR